MKTIYKILIAEDEPIALPISDYLEDQGYEVKWVKDIDSLRKHVERADVLLVDARLPLRNNESIKDFTGLNTVAELLDENKIKPTVPIIFFSNFSENECQQSLKERPILTGRYCWLHKPFEMVWLEEKINEQLKKLRN